MNLENKNFSIENDVASIRISKEIYPKEVIMQATYVLIDKYYFLVDVVGDYFEIEMRSKESKGILTSDVLAFFDELIESSAYIDQLKRTSKVREIILEKALLSQKKK